MFVCFSCGIKCPRGKFGLECKQTCLCQNEAECVPENGFCICTEGKSCD